MRLKKPVKKLLGSLGFGTLITILPLLLSGLFWADWFKSMVAFADWPMLVVQSLYRRTLPGNAGGRLLVFLLINVASWTLIAYLAFASFSTRRTIVSKRLRGN
jgi:hypothetical protein